MDTTVEEILEWLKKSGMTRKELADEMGMNYYSLSAILSGSTPLSAKRADVIARVMAEHDKQVRAKLHPEVQVKVEAWAKMMHAEIDKVVEMVIAHTMGVELGNDALPADYTATRSAEPEVAEPAAAHPRPGMD